MDEKAFEDREMRKSTRNSRENKMAHKRQNPIQNKHFFRGLLEIS